MKILIIGGTGLISTAITRKLLERGDDVTLFNRGRTTPRFKGTVHSIVGDRNDYERFEAAFSRDSFDVVIDMVSFHPDQTASAIRAFRGRTKQFVHCSTVCVYSGPVTRIPTLETEPYHSIGQYGKNKILCENLLFEAHKKGEIPVTVMRPSHSYGAKGSRCLCPETARDCGRHAMSTMWQKASSGSC
jgi:nucleoside-diphosphate-sugar epimerase